MIAVLADPGVLFVIASWALAAAVCSAACRRLTRAWAAVGTIAGLGLMAGGYTLWGLVVQDPALLTLAAPDLGVAAAIMAVVIVLGPPARHPDE